MIFAFLLSVASAQEAQHLADRVDEQIDLGGELIELLEAEAAEQPKLVLLSDEVVVDPTSVETAPEAPKASQDAAQDAATTETGAAGGETGSTP